MAVYSSENGEEVKKLIEEMNEILNKIKELSATGDLQGILEIEKRHHEIANRLRELQIS
ncbi:hypothetical protein FIU93_21375 [Labrenzia sp. THAF35]|uniref:hypothetical protein n=1 Tax=Labrenzia sp. THAF35 TaxID=2587854 RepID=UPI0012A7A462|nr:hypothetical protein [Labrenzia sp. THAF35]QFT69352.1 hypothetical protein FIU93_21375 [Labrenzia sp. THAF35]